MFFDFEGSENVQLIGTFLSKQHSQKITQK